MRLDLLEFNEGKTQLISSISSLNDIKNFKSYRNFFIFYGSNNMFFYKYEDGNLISFKKFKSQSSTSIANLNLNFIKFLNCNKNSVSCFFENLDKKVDLYLDEGLFTPYVIDNSKVMSIKEKNVFSGNYGIIDATINSKGNTVFCCEKLNSIYEIRSGAIYRIFGLSQNGCSVSLPIKYSRCNGPTSVERYENGILFCDSNNKMIRYFDNKKSEIVCEFDFKPIKMKINEEEIYVLDENNVLHCYDSDFKELNRQDNVYMFDVNKHIKKVFLIKG